MNIEKITKAKYAISCYLRQTKEMIHAKNHVMLALKNFDEVNSGAMGGNPTRRSFDTILDELEQQIRVAEVRISNLKRFIDEEVI